MFNEVSPEYALNLHKVYKPYAPPNIGYRAVLKGLSR